MDGWMDTARKEGPKIERVLDGSENGSGTPLDVLGGDGWIFRPGEKGMKTEQFWRVGKTDA